MLCLAAAASVGGCKKKGGGGTTPEGPVGPEEPAFTGNYIAADGESEYTIVTPAAPMPAETTAATELSQYLARITGVTLDVVPDSRLKKTATTEKYISVGETSLYKAQNFKAENLNGDGFLLKTVDNTLFIVGECERGTLYGVYEFLEREAGCRFLSRSYEHIPTVTKLGLRALDVKEIPAFEVRSDFYRPMSYEVQFTAKMRYWSQFSSFTEMAEPIGGSQMTYWNNAGHSFYQLVPHRTHYAAHPDWYSGSDASYSQPCFSNGLNDDGTLAEGESFMRALVDAVEATVLANEKLQYIMLGQEDNDNVCRCPRCTAQLEALGGQRSAQLVLVTNAVAREVKARLAARGIERKLYFVTFSYWWSMNAPTKTNADGTVTAAVPQVVPRDDVYIYFAPIGACYSHPINDTSCSKNVNDIYRQFENWRNITDRFFVWDYATNFNDYLSWYPNLSVLQRNLKYYREMGVAGILTEGAITAQNYYEQDLECWLLSKLMWDPDRPINELRAEYDRYYFGEKAGPILTEYTDFMNGYFEQVSRTQSDSTLHAAIYTNHTPWLCSVDTLNENFLNAAMGYMERAEAAIGGDTTLTAAQKEQYLYNLSQAKIQVMYMMYKNYDAVLYTTDEARYAFMQEFFALAEKLDVNALSENGRSLVDLKNDALGG